MGRNMEGTNIYKIFAYCKFLFKKDAELAFALEFESIGIFFRVAFHLRSSQIRRHLSGNRIKEVGDRYFEGLGNLEILSLSHNMIFTIQPNAFNYSPRLRSL